MKSLKFYSLVLFPIVFWVVSNETKSQALAPHVRDELLGKATQWGLPQPSVDARLLKIRAYTSAETDYYILGFVEPGISSRALVGFSYWDLTANSHATETVLSPEALSLSDITPTSHFTNPHGINLGLLTGIQLLRRGNEKLGLALIEKSLGTDAGHSYSAFRSPAGEAPVLMLARSCLAAAMNEITKPKADFLQIKQRIERLLADQPKLKSEATDWALESLTASVAYKPAPVGSIEQIIDDYLLDAGTEEQKMKSLNEEFSTLERTLILKGFEAIPALLNQWGSKRFTNHLKQGFNNFPGYPMKAGQVIDAYLQRLANNEFGANWLDRQKGFTATDDDVQAWWKEASALGEEQYVKKYTVAFDTEKKPRLSFALLLLARERYPHLLPDIYRAILKTSHFGWPVAEAMVESKAVAKEEKIQLLLAAVATDSEAHRNDGLRYLRKLDPVLADIKLLQALSKAPSTTKKEYWVDQDAGLSRFVSLSTNPDVWKTFHTLLGRVDLGMRMELISHLEPPHEAPVEILKSFYKVYDRFQDDKTVRDVLTSPKFSGPGAGFPHDKIEMRDFLYWHWAEWLKLKVEVPKREATASEWEQYRSQVSLAVQKYREEQNLQPEKR